MDENKISSRNFSKSLPVQPNGRHVVGIDVGQREHAAAGSQHTETGMAVLSFLPMTVQV